MNLLRELQDTVKAVAQSAPGLAGVTFLVEDAKDLQTEIDKAISKVGLLVLVFNPNCTASEDTDGRQVPDNMIAEIRIEIGEEPVIWRKTGRPSCMDVADQLARTLHGYEPSNLFQPFKVTAIEFTPTSTRQVYAISVRTRFLLPDPQPSL